MAETKPITKEEMLEDIFYVINDIRPDALHKYKVDLKKFTELALNNDRLFFKLIQRTLFKADKLIKETGTSWEELKR